MFGFKRRHCEVMSYLQGIFAQNGCIMSQISDYAARVKTAFNTINTGIAGVAEDVRVMKEKIEHLQNSPGPISPEDQAELDSLETLANETAARISEVDASTPPTP